MYVRVLKSYINVREIPMNPSEILNRSYESVRIRLFICL